MWSVGCIAAELLTGKTLFSGSSTLEQLEKIIELTGMVGKDDLEALDSPVAECLISQINPKVRLFSDYFSLVDPVFLPLLRGLLQFNPFKRLNATVSWLGGQWPQDFRIQCPADLGLSNRVEMSKQFPSTLE